ncbi:MAG: DUF2905 domain-containing protein [Nautiliaceae bacterium]
MAKIFIFIGIVFIIIGLLLYFFKDFPLFHLPGDIVIKKENFVFYFPITSSILISVILSLIFYIISKIFQ